MRGFGAIVLAGDFSGGMTLRLWPVLSSNSLAPRFALAWLAAVVGALALPIAQGSSAGGGSLSLAVTPSQLTMTVGAVAKGVITITNADLGEEATNVNVQAIPTTSSLSVTVANPPTSIPAGGSTATNFTVTRTQAGTAPDVGVQFVVTYSQEPMAAAVTTSTTATTSATTPTSTRPAGVAQVAVVDLTVHAAATPTLLTASFKSSATLTIDEDRPASPRW